MRLNLNKFILKRKMRQLTKQMYYHMNEGYVWSTKDRTKSDEHYAKSKEIEKEIDELKEQINS